MYILLFDGMFRSLHSWTQRTGLMGYGWIIFKRESIIAHGFGMFIQRENATSCISEYLALIEGLEALADLHVGNAPVEVRGDAKFVINQMTGIASVNSVGIRHLYKRALKLAQGFNNLSWVSIPRKENRYADTLSRSRDQTNRKCLRPPQTDYGSSPIPTLCFRQARPAHGFACL